MGQPLIHPAGSLMAPTGKNKDYYCRWALLQLAGLDVLRDVYLAYDRWGADTVDCGRHH
jgi:hypothetical protein